MTKNYQVELMTVFMILNLFMTCGTGSKVNSVYFAREVNRYDNGTHTSSSTFFFLPSSLSLAFQQTSLVHGTEAGERRAQMAPEAANRDEAEKALRRAEEHFLAGNVAVERCERPAW